MEIVEQLPTKTKKTFINDLTNNFKRVTLIT
jgi:hypothetical protein